MGEKKKSRKDKEVKDEGKEIRKSKEKVEKKTKKRKLKESAEEQPEVSKKKKKTAKDESEFDEGVEPSVAQREGDFSKFRISQKTIDNLEDRGITYLFPIQASTFNYIFDGEDVIGQARTGTGKTLSFALPLVEKLQDGKLSQKRGRAPKVLVMAPTRELAKQVGNEFENLKSNLEVYCIYGGMPYEPQENAINSGLDVLVGTPGRILDFMRQGTLDLSKLKHVVLDEVDRMLDMGFAESVEEVLAASYAEDREDKPQTLLFSATLPPWAVNTAKKYMKKDRKLVDLIGHDKLKTSTSVQHMAIKCHYTSRASTIGDIVQVYCGAHGRTMIFAQTKKEANELALNSVLKQETQVLHGDIPQKQREVTLKSFREGKFRCLVATDVAARGLDIPEIDLVVQCEPPKDVDAYIHRSGRTGRAGREGICIVFYKPQQEGLLQPVERKAGIKFKRIGAPQPVDIIKASAEDAKRFLEQIPSDVLDYFRDAAEKLIEDKGAIDAVAAALAQISGTTEIKSRSLLTSQEGYTTYILRCADTELRGTGYMWRVIENNLPPEVKPEVRGMRLISDRMGVVFDVPRKLDNLIKESWTDRRGVTLERARELPELVDSGQSARPNSFDQRSGWNRGGVGSWGNNNNRQSWGGRNQGGSGGYNRFNSDNSQSSFGGNRGFGGGFKNGRLNSDSPRNSPGGYANKSDNKSNGFRSRYQ
ncbi:nucleolar RNA helicase 2 [Nematostella vectensis]|uniref:nucleolar RNA helicase 2 n=1 Tax=Nematostella vectensis TaxID=45351 RepID=UPI0020775681|nr:nucleolar RNA helicase 2 [Nematostella vectensis]